MVGTSNESDPEMASECIWVFSIPKAISWGPCYKAIAQKSWLPAGEIRQYRRYFHSQTYNMSMFGKKNHPNPIIYHLPFTQSSHTHQTPPARFSCAALRLGMYCRCFRHAGDWQCVESKTKDPEAVSKAT